MKNKKAWLLVGVIISLLFLAGWNLPDKTLYVKAGESTIYFPQEARNVVKLNEENQPINISNQRFTCIWSYQGVNRVCYSDPWFQPYIIEGDNISYITLSGNIESNFIKSHDFNEYIGSLLAVLVFLQAIGFIVRRGN